MRLLVRTLTLNGEKYYIRWLCMLASKRRMLWCIALAHALACNRDEVQLLGRPALRTRYLAIIIHSIISWIYIIIGKGNIAGTPEGIVMNAV